MVAQSNLIPLHQKGRRPLRSTPFLIGSYKPQRLFVDLAGADGCLLTVGGVEQTLAQADVLGSNLHQLVVGDVLQRLLQREGARRHQLHGDVGGRGTLVAQVLGTMLAPISSLAFVLDQIRLQKEAPEAAAAAE